MPRAKPLAAAIADQPTPSRNPLLPPSLDSSRPTAAPIDDVSFSRDDLLYSARGELYERAHASPSFIEYVRQNEIDTNAVVGFCGCIAVLPISIYQGSTFDFDDASGGEAVEAVVIEAFDRQGETVIDLVAWPLDRPSLVLTMFGQAPLLGMWQALNAYSYAFGKPLTLHRTPLAWLQANCDGAALVRPEAGVRLLLDADGPIACQDRAHAVELVGIQTDAARRRLVIRKTGKSAG